MKKAIPNSLLGEFAEFIHTRMALHFPPSRRNDLERRACMAAKDFEFEEAADFLRWVVSSPLSQAQMETLVSHLTIHETYFWREPRVFAALETLILPELLSKQPIGKRRLRIWSAGCSTGEEPYSIAIALLRTIPHIVNWDITILATDLNPRMLRKAAEGVYGHWSFRNAPPWLTEKYFRPTPEGRREIQPQIRDMVRFAYLNLAEDVYPSFVNNTNAIDLLFCRNVLMYFTPQRAQHTVHRFFECLADGGWLIVSASELCQPIFTGFQAIRLPSASVYRKSTHTSHISSADAMQAQESEAQPVLETPVHIPRISPLSLACGATSIASPPAATPVSEPPSAGAPPPAEGNNETAQMQTSGHGKEEHDIRVLANEGKLEEALALCDKAIDTDKLNLAFYFLRSAILQELGQYAEAIIALRHALYLKPDYALAHFVLGNLAMRQGDARTAQRCFDNAQNLLRTYSDNEILPDSEGLTVKRFKEIVGASIKSGAFV